ncbi:MAG: 1-acyl-sn-glycerol-3-phosphate acyltransferase [Gammaproteobacteria bacterium]|nr:1-acyl-sn-glycerol-3-phosphate acyltransferase [Gammaproteobacteria bacterium]
MKSVSIYLFGSWAWFVFSIILLVMVCCFPFTRSVASTRKLAKNCCTAIIKLIGIELVVEGSENLVDEPSVLVANHASYTDPMILQAALPPHYAYVAKKELKYVPFAKYVLEKMGTHLVDRRDAKQGANDFKKIMQSNKDKDSIIFFPEATFLKEEGLLKFKKGAFLTAIKNQVPVIPVTLNGTRELLTSESWLPKKVNISVKIHAQIYTTDDSIKAQEVSDASREMILSSLDEPDLNHRSFS